MANKKELKKKPAKPDKEKVEAPEVVQNTDTKSPEFRPSAGVYMRATWQMLRGWIKSNKKRSLLIILAVVLIIGGLAFLLRPGSDPLSNDDIIVQVNRELDIYGDGNPAILTVVDDEKVIQPFLNQAENNDKVILYYKAKKAVLFRPSEGRIIRHGSYTPPEAKVFIRRGANDSSNVDRIRNQLEDVDGITVASEDISARRDYQGVTIVNVTDRYDDKVRELEELFNINVVRLPAGETFPDADILLIVGQ